MLALDRLTRRFGDVRALDGLSFNVEPGQMFGFVLDAGDGGRAVVGSTAGACWRPGGRVPFRAAWRATRTPASSPGRAL